MTASRGQSQARYGRHDVKRPRGRLRWPTRPSRWACSATPSRAKAVAALPSSSGKQGGSARDPSRAKSRASTAGRSRHRHRSRAANVEPAQAPRGARATAQLARSIAAQPEPYSRASGILLPSHIDRARCHTSPPGRRPPSLRTRHLANAETERRGWPCSSEAGGGHPVCSLGA
jgi:hypothetical protein